MMTSLVSRTEVVDAIEGVRHSPDFNLLRYADQAKLHMFFALATAILYVGDSINALAGDIRTSIPEKV